MSHCGLTGSFGKFALGCAVLFCFPRAVQAQNVVATPIFYFPSSGVDGFYPIGGVTADAQGRLYGASQNGIESNTGGIYRLTPPSGQETSWTAEVLANFGVPFGGAPFSGGGLTLDSAGNVYGATWNGGTIGRGQVYKLNNAPGWPITVLHQFSPGDGRYPDANLAFGPGGLLYGTTSYNNGTDYSVSPLGDSVEYKTINKFAQTSVTVGGGSAGLVPVPGRSYLVGVTSKSGSVPGMFYAVQADAAGAGKASLIYTFGSGQDVDNPTTPPIVGYGKLAGSAFGCSDSGGNGNNFGSPKGGIYQITADGNNSYRESVIFNFPDLQPPYATAGPTCSVVQADANGTLYGITGGSEQNNFENAFFELLPPATGGGAWTEKVLLYFDTGGAYEPQFPWARVGNSYYVAFMGSDTSYGMVLQLTVTP